MLSRADFFNRQELSVWGVPFWQNLQLSMKRKIHRLTLFRQVKLENFSKIGSIRSKERDTWRRACFAFDDLSLRKDRKLHWPFSIRLAATVHEMHSQLDCLCQERETGD